ncbi:MAG TPA: nucleotide exchange factor GrpE [Thermomicrobiales bacterium]|nr:nucleotide exchange factor GrpE [Thermomicrobiales bacterium]
MTRKSDKARDQQVADETMNGTDQVADGEHEENVAAADAPETDLAAELARVTEERDGYFDQLQRSRAEFVNFRKRTDQERLKLAEIFTAETLKQFLPVLDDFERAIEAVPESDKASGWVAGISLIQQKLSGILERAGVQAVDSLNQPFDPAVHEAVATEPGTSGQTVVEVYQKGYKLGDTLLRAAMVKTGDAPESVGSASTTTFDA